MKYTTLLRRAYLEQDRFEQAVQHMRDMRSVHLPLLRKDRQSRGQSTQCFQDCDAVPQSVIAASARVQQSHMQRKDQEGGEVERIGGSCRAIEGPPGWRAQRVGIQASAVR